MLFYRDEHIHIFYFEFVSNDAKEIVAYCKLAMRKKNNMSAWLHGLINMKIFWIYLLFNGNVTKYAQKTSPNTVEKIIEPQGVKIK